jgi:hypothetical protein
MVIHWPQFALQGFLALREKSNAKTILLKEAFNFFYFFVEIRHCNKIKFSLSLLCTHTSLQRSKHLRVNTS